MKYHYLFLTKQGSTSDDAFLELSPFLSDIYEVDDPESGHVQIGGYSDDPNPPPQLIHVILENCSAAEEIDWQKQWADFAADFHDGVAHIDLEELGGSTLLLKPGGGFGDLSHPTTRLVLSLMAPNVKGKTVFDIGTGSGILSIAAILLGAKQAWGIDIDIQAIKHAQENAILNQVEAKAHFSTEIDPASVPSEPFVIVMNMIQSEQIAAWQSILHLHAKPALIITSGLLSSQRSQYVEFCSSWGWTLIQEKEEEGWVGFIFSVKSSPD